MEHISARNRTLAALLAVVVVTAVVLFAGEDKKPTTPPPMPAPEELIGHLQPRSGKWPTVRKHYLEGHPVCEACGRDDRIEVHHVEPFHEDPSKELDPDNLITLCRRCHELLGHLDSWKSHNPQIREDASWMMKKIKSRP